MSKATIEDIVEMMKQLRERGISKGQIQGTSSGFRDMIYVGMTREQLEEEIPNGCYEIGHGNTVAYTGKGGYINYILSLTEEWNKLK